MKRKSADISPPPSTNNVKQTSEAPDYGSKEYWEARYKSNTSLGTIDGEAATSGSTSESDANKPGRIVDGVKLSPNVEAGHAWYFTYEELRPLIMGLILDVNDDEVEVEDYLSDDGWEEVDADAHDSINDEADQEDSEHSEDDTEPKDTTSYDENISLIDPLESYLKHLPTNLQSRPKSILEIGCGDVPLGSSLTSELNSLQLSTDHDVRHVVCSVECIDYSSVVIDNLNKQQKELIQTQHLPADTKKYLPPLHPKYSTCDARKLPYTSNSISIILEKGTLDAMLSHPDEGIPNSISIVKEMARVCEVNGAILIVSHLNARDEKGMGWMNDVVLVGLKEELTERRKTRNTDGGNSTEETEIVWSIEVHGGEAIDEDDGNERYGPAVYILKKKGISTSLFTEIMEKKKKNDGVDDVLPVNIEFLTYS